MVFFHPWLPWCRLSAPQLLQRLVIPGAGAGWLEETAGVRVSSAGAAIQTDVWSSLSRRCCGQSARAPLLGNSFTLTCSQQQHKVVCVLAATVAVPIAMSSKTPDRTWLAERDASKRVKKKKRNEKKAEREWRMRRSCCVVAIAIFSAASAVFHLASHPPSAVPHSVNRRFKHPSCLPSASVRDRHAAVLLREGQVR